MNDPSLTKAEWQHIRDLVESLLNTIRYDDTGVTDDLIEEALIVGQILNVIPKEQEE